MCFTALGGDELHGGHEDPTSFDLAFSSVEVAGLAPIEVAGQARLPDFSDGDIQIPAAPGATKLRLRSPVKGWFHGPAVQRCDAVPPAPAPTRPAPSATVPAPETRAWARTLRAAGALVHGRRVPAPVAAELSALLALGAGASLRWVRALAPAEGEAGPALLVATHGDRRRATSLGGGDAGPSSSLELRLSLLHDDGHAYGLADGLPARMHTDAAWELGPTVRIDDDPHPDTVLLAPVLDGETIHDGLIVALTGWRTVSHVPLFVRDEPWDREAMCFGRVEGHPALFVAQPPNVVAFVADATGHLARAQSLWGQVLAAASEPSSFTPIHTNDGSRAQDGPLDGAELRACPGDGQSLDLTNPSGDKLLRVHRLALSKAAVGRTAGVIELTRRAAP